MGARSDFEIRPEDDGLKVFAFTSWWSDGKSVSSAGGLACSAPFTSIAGAKAWVELQFSVPRDTWLEHADGTFTAAKGEPLPEPKVHEARKERQPVGSAA